jgi:hypothetical protein
MTTSALPLTKGQPAAARRPAAAGGARGGGKRGVAIKRHRRPAS